MTPTVQPILYETKAAAKDAQRDNKIEDLEAKIAEKEKEITEGEASTEGQKTPTVQPTLYNTKADAKVVPDEKVVPKVETQLGLEKLFTLELLILRGLEKVFLHFSLEDQRDKNMDEKEAQRDKNMDEKDAQRDNKIEDLEAKIEEKEKEIEEREKLIEEITVISDSDQISHPESKIEAVIAEIDKVIADRISKMEAVNKRLLDQIHHNDSILKQDNDSILDKENFKHEYNRIINLDYDIMLLMFKKIVNDVVCEAKRDYLENELRILENDKRLQENALYENNKGAIISDIIDLHINTYNENLRLDYEISEIEINKYLLRIKIPLKHNRRISRGSEPMYTSTPKPDE
ncbi:chromosome partition protein Smc-like [Zingiber officinale]|uniref:chromosome partition protein Smc-like n=1 Tax=Zingiber officinale TaxID=94328 RepID=UPI001C4C3136|nr:chromosome partition protein Smc-like [Zingiber officinale]